MGRGINGTPVPYLLVGEAAGQTFDHAFAGVIVYAIEPGAFLLQERDDLTDWNPNRTSIFGGRLREEEMPSWAAVRELAAETGIVVSRQELQVLRAYPESIRTPKTVFRAIYVLFLDQIPRGMRVGEGRAIKIVPVTKVMGVPNFTTLSREDVEIFLGHTYPRGRAA